VLEATKQAKRTLAAHHGISVSEAFERLRAHARNHNATIHAVADAVPPPALSPSQQVARTSILMRGRAWARLARR
jgi:hypothetical protein